MQIAPQMTDSTPQHGFQTTGPAQRPAYTLERIKSRADLPRVEAEALLVEHTSLMHQRTIDAGGPDFDHMAHARAFWAKVDEVMPPHGSYYLARDASGALVGTGALRRRPDGGGEMKHLYVQPQMRRSGLGRALVAARIADARAMGMPHLNADTFIMNTEMISLYRRLGFDEVPPDPLAATVGISPDLQGQIVYFRMDLG